MSSLYPQSSAEETNFTKPKTPERRQHRYHTQLASSNSGDVRPITVHQDVVMATWKKTLAHSPDEAMDDQLSVMASQEDLFAGPSLEQIDDSSQGVRGTPEILSQGIGRTPNIPSQSFGRTPDVSSQGVRGTPDFALVNPKYKSTPAVLSGGKVATKEDSEHSFHSLQLSGDSNAPTPQDQKLSFLSAVTHIPNLSSSPTELKKLTFSSTCSSNDERSKVPLESQESRILATDQLTCSELIGMSGMSQEVDNQDLHVPKWYHDGAQSGAGFLGALSPESNLLIEKSHLIGSSSSSSNSSLELRTNHYGSIIQQSQHSVQSQSQSLLAQPKPLTRTNSSSESNSSLDLCKFSQSPNTLLSPKVSPKTSLTESQDFNKVLPNERNASNAVDPPSSTTIVGAVNVPDPESTDLFKFDSETAPSCQGDELFLQFDHFVILLILKWSLTIYYTCLLHRG